MRQFPLLVDGLVRNFDTDGRVLDTAENVVGSWSTIKGNLIRVTTRFDAPAPSNNESSMHQDNAGRWHGYVSMGLCEGGRRDRRHVRESQ